MAASDSVNLQLDLKTGKALADVERMQRAFVRSAESAKRVETAVASAARAEGKAAQAAEQSAKRRAEWAKQAARAAASKGGAALAEGTDLGGREATLVAAAQMTAGQTRPGGSRAVETALLAQNVRLVAAQRAHQQRLEATARRQLTTADTIAALARRALAGDAAAIAELAVLQATAQAQGGGR